MSEAARACATITLAYHGLEFRCPSAGVSEDRPLAPEDVALLESGAKQYQQMARQDTADELLKLGEEMFTWLNGPTRTLSRMLDTCQPPLLIEFEALAKTENGEPAEEAKRARTFLNAPWELLAADGLHWALRDGILFCPVRRVGKPLSPPAASLHRLSLVFMAAAPRGADNLDYEAEEASILTATQNLRLNMVVEESGPLDLLAACSVSSQARNPTARSATPPSRWRPGTPRWGCETGTQLLCRKP